MPIMQESVKSLLLEMSFQGKTLFTGTGFLVHSNIGVTLITNRHNVTGRSQTTGQPLFSHGGVPDSVTIWQNSHNGAGHWHQETHKLLDNDETPLWKEHPDFGDKADIVALPLNVNALTKVFAYNVGPAQIDLQVVPGDALSVIGFPFGLSGGRRFAIWATGFLASEPEVDYDERPVFLIDCRSRPGQSGSPVVASRSGGAVTLNDGRTVIFEHPVSTFLGIYSGRINEQSDLGIVWKRTAVERLVRSL